MKRTLKILSGALILLVAFRGPIFNSLVKYKAVGTRPEVTITNQVLLDNITSKSQGLRPKVEDIARIADEITTETLSFTTTSASSNPNELVNSPRAHCVGYAAMFNSIANTIIQENAWQDRLAATHHIGSLTVVGVEPHHYFASQFFKDHDFNEIHDLSTGTRFSYDASVSDYLRIHGVARSEE